MTRNKRNYEKIIEILASGEILTSREVYERMLNSRSITKVNKTKPTKYKPNYKSVQNLLQSCKDVVRTNPKSRELAKWKLREEE